MKHLILLLAVLATFTSCTDNGTNGDAMQGNSDLVTSLDSMSYALGALFASQFDPQGITINAQQFAKGYAQSADSTSYLDQDGSRTIMNNFQQAMMVRQGVPFTSADTIPFSIDSLSYTLGFDLQNQMKGFDITLSAPTLLQGALDKDSETALLDKAGRDAQVQALTQMIQEKEMQKALAAAGPNMEAGKAFIAEKASDPEVKSTASGLHYKVIEAGSGASPVATDNVTVHYTGTLIDGTVFDSSVERGQPATFGLTQVIAGWTEGVQLMKPGAKYQFYIPYQLAYGERGSPPNIGPGETLIFDIELISIASE